MYGYILGDLARCTRPRLHHPKGLPSSLALSSINLHDYPMYHATRVVVDMFDVIEYSRIGNHYHSTVAVLCSHKFLAPSVPRRESPVQAIVRTPDVVYSNYHNRTDNQ
jgi:hypothetical protein